MLKLQNAILYLSLAGSYFTIGCMDHDREWAKKFDGLATNDPQLFVDWARLQLDMYEEQFLGFKQELELANEKGLDLFGKEGQFDEIDKLQVAIHELRDKRRGMCDIMSKIANRLQALQLRNVADCYEAFKLRYKPELQLPWKQLLIYKCRDDNPFGLENYNAFNNGREASSALPHAESAQLDQLFAKARDLLSKYCSVKHRILVVVDEVAQVCCPSFEKEIKEPVIIEVVID
jgi:hypothetical protein